MVTRPPCSAPFTSSAWTSTSIVSLPATQPGAARLIEPGARLATARGLEPETASSSLAETLEPGSVREDDLYAAMDWLLLRQQRIEKRLAARHLQEGTVVLYDISSTYFEGRHCRWANWGTPAMNALAISKSSLGY